MDLILSRRTVHSFTDEDVSKHILEQAVLAGVHGLNHRLSYPWKFISAGPKSRLQLANLSIKIKFEKAQDEISETTKISLRQKFMESGALLVLGLKKCADEEQAREDYAAMACAVQNMSLYLASEAYGSKWGTGKITRDLETYRILGLDKNKIEIVGFFWIGKYKQLPPKPERPSLDNFITYIG